MTEHGDLRAAMERADAALRAANYRTLELRAPDTDEETAVPRSTDERYWRLLAAACVVVILILAFVARNHI